MAAKIAFGSEVSLSWTEVWITARRLVAAACLAFLKDTDLEEERWQPYKSWAIALDFADSIITFNYDRVLEHLDRFEVVVPGVAAGAQGKPQVLKLHGSVDWKREEDEKGKVTYSAASEEFALLCGGHEIGVATPGPTKRLATIDLESVWTRARNDISDAEVIIFVGYRFPPSDAEAREKLLEAIRENKSPHLQLHIVLGPDRGKPDVVRLEQLLRYSMNRCGRLDLDRRGGTVGHEPETFTLSTHALFAEDFLTVWDRELLWPKRFIIGEFVRV